jgi:hypothetical protein
MKVISEYEMGFWKTVHPTGLSLEAPMQITDVKKVSYSLGKLILLQTPEY